MSLEINIKPDESEYFCICSEDDEFSIVIGCIEDLILDEDFLKVQNEFMDKYWMEFEDSEENKHEYMDIFQEYQKQIENFIETYLQKKIDGFEMEDFILELLKRKDDLEGEVFEVLFTFTDFLRFKEMFLDYKSMKEGKTVDLSSDICISSIKRAQN